MPIRVILADDHTVFREGLRRMLCINDGLVIVGEAATTSEAARLAADCQPDLVLLDVRMKDGNGLDAIAEILRRSPRTAVLILTMNDDKPYVVRAIEAGARGYLLKDISIDALVRAIYLVCGGTPYFSPRVSQHAEEAMSNSAFMQTAPPRRSHQGE